MVSVSDVWSFETGGSSWQQPKHVDANKITRARRPLQVPRFCVGIAAVELSEEYCPTLHFFSAPSMELPPVPRLLSAASKYYSATTLPLLLLLLSLLSLLPCTLVVRLVSSLILVTLEYYPHHSHLSVFLSHSCDVLRMCVEERTAGSHAPPLLERQHFFFLST